MLICFSLFAAVITNPYPDYNMLRNPKFKNAGKIVSLSTFLGLAKKSTSLSGVLIRIDVSSLSVMLLFFITYKSVTKRHGY